MQNKTRIIDYKFYEDDKTFFSIFNTYFFIQSKTSKFQILKINRTKYIEYKHKFVLEDHI